MKYDYTMTTKSGIEITSLTLAQAKQEAKAHAADQPIIDQYSFDMGELSGVYYTLDNNKFVKHI